MTAARVEVRGGWPLAAAVLYAWLIPFQPVVVLPDGSELRFAAADLVAPLVVLAALALPRRRLPPLALALAALPLVALFTTLVAATDRSLSAYALGKTAGLFYLCGFCLALARALPGGAEASVLRGLANGAVWSAAVGLVGLVAWHRGASTSLVDGGRLCSTMTGDPNIYCSLLAVGLLATVTDGARRPTTRLVYGVVLGAALLATGSRSGLVGLLVGATVAGLLWRRDRWVAGARAAYLGACLALAAGMLLLTDAGAQGARDFADHVWRLRTVESRFDLYRQALAEFAEHPVLGLGVGGFRDMNVWTGQGMKFHAAVHNTYLWGLVDLGLGGLLVPLVVAGGLVYALRATRAPGTAMAARPVAAGLAAMAVFNLFVDGFYQRHFWVLLGCALLLVTPRGGPRRLAVQEAEVLS